VQKLGACLLDAREDDTGPSTANMNKWAAEATSLLVCMALRNPWAVRAFNAAVDATSSPGKTCAGQWKSSHLLVCIASKRQIISGIVRYGMAWHGMTYGMRWYDIDALV